MLSKEKRELLVRVARLRYINEYTQRRIGLKLEPQKKQPAVAKLLEEAQRRGVVRHEIDADATITGEEDQELSDQLRKAFGLDTAHAIELPEDLDSDELHVALANYTAEIVRNSLRSSDHLAVAGGRTIARLCKAVAHRPVNVHNVVVTPLGGRLWSGHLWKAPSRLAKHFEQPFNPDDCALILARGLHAGLQPEITFSQVSHPLYARSEKEARKIIEENCAFRPHAGWNWNLRAPSQAFVGIGMVTTKTHHRLAEWLGSGEEFRHRSPLSEITGALEFARHAGLPAFGDVANRLFISLPLPSDIPHGKADRDALLKGIRTLDNILLRVNRKSVVMDWDHLRDILSVTAIAGGTHKAAKTHAIWTLLLATSLFWREDKFRLVSSITTDANTAQILVRERNLLEQKGTEAKSWFRNALRVLFPKHIRKSDVGIARTRGVKRQPDDL